MISNSKKKNIYFTKNNLLKEKTQFIKKGNWILLKKIYFLLFNFILNFFSTFIKKNRFSIFILKSFIFILFLLFLSF